jgi:hypothetical protein
VLEKFSGVLKDVYTTYSYLTSKRERSGISRPTPAFFMDTWHRLLTDASIFDECKVLGRVPPLRPVGAVGTTRCPGRRWRKDS